MPQTDFSSKIYAGVAFLLFLAVAPLPYGYYTFMRIIVCGCAGIAAYRGFTAGEKGLWPWALAFIAIIFNPVAVIHMTKEIWMVVDIVTSLFFGFLAYKRFIEERPDRTNE